MATWSARNHQTLNNTQDVIAALLANRKITTPDIFFSPPPPRAWSETMHGVSMDKVSQFKHLLSNATGSVLVYGDYDADGVLASSIMASVLEHMGLQVHVYIPDRRQDGYGMSPESLKRIITQHPDINTVVTVDQGIKAHQAVDFLHTCGLQVIITDHHLADDTLPAADLIVHSPLVCGSGVAYFLTRHLATKPLNQTNLQLAAIGTVTDVMPLQDINRHLLFHGLSYLTATDHPGLLALLNAAQIHPQSIEAYHLGYQIGPRLNAEGRIGDPMSAYQLLRSTSLDQASTLASALDLTNRKRQDLTEQMLKSALETVNPEQKILTTASADYDEGIIGLIAGKLTQAFHKPAIAISFDDDLAKGSVRSIKAVNVAEVLDKARHLLSTYGGHAQAGGFSLPTQNLPKFLKLINQIGESIPADSLQKKLEIDAFLQFNTINSDLVTALDKFAPFGHGNHRPIFATKQVKVVRVSSLGRDARHLKLILQDKTAKVECLAWGYGQDADKFTSGTVMDIAYNLKSTIWRGDLQVNLELVDYH